MSTPRAGYKESEIRAMLGTGIAHIHAWYAGSLRNFAIGVCDAYLWSRVPEFHGRIYDRLGITIGGGDPPGVKECLSTPTNSAQNPNNKLLINAHEKESGRKNPKHVSGSVSGPVSGKEARTATDRVGDRAWDLGRGRSEDVARNVYLDTEPNTGLVMPREFGKSTIMWIAALWAALNRYKKYIVYISSSEEKAVELIQPVKKEVESNQYLRAMYGDLVTKEWSKGSFVLKNGTKFLARGRGQNVRGLRHLAHRPDLVILDDIEDDKRVENKNLREEDRKWFDTQVKKGVDSQRGTIVCVGTILHVDSLMSNIAIKDDRPEKYRSFKPLIFNALDRNEKSIWEKKFSTAALLAEQRQDPFGFAQERMNRPISFQRGYFKPEHFRYYDLKGGVITTDRETLDINEGNIYLTCDLANTENDLSDFTVVLASLVDEHGRIFVLDYFKGRYADPYKVVSEIFRMSDQWKPRLIGIENVSFQKWLMPILKKDPNFKNHHGRGFIELKADRKKVRRIGSLHPRFVNGTIYFRRFMKDLEEELITFPEAAHDDISDALAYVLQIMQLPLPERSRPEKTGTFGWWKNLYSENKRRKERERRYTSLKHLIPEMTYG